MGCIKMFKWLTICFAIFILSSGSALALVCSGNYLIDNIDTSGDLAALSGCTEITGDLDIINTTLTSLTGLESLTDIGGGLDIWENPALNSLDGLENLTNIFGDWLLIDGNSSLTDLCGLYSTNFDGIELYIIHNNLLSMDTANALKDQLGYDGFSIIGDNNGSGLVSCDLEGPGIYGNVSGAVQEGVYMLLYSTSCGSSTLEDYVLTAADGSYSFTGLSNGNYKVKPIKTGYSFSPPEIILDFNNTAVTGVDFTSY